MRIGILSDTHLQQEDIDNNSPMYQRFFNIVGKAFNNVDYILHAGDIAHFGVIKILQQWAPVGWVCGNCDYPQEIQTEQKIIWREWEGIKTIMTHERMFLYPYASQGFQVFVFGHSHIASIEVNDDHQLWINPGSIKRPMGAGGQPSVAILTIENSHYSAKLIKMNELI